MLAALLAELERAELEAPPVGADVLDEARGLLEEAAGVAAEIEDAHAGFLLLRKTGPTPERFPRRPGRARKRPLA